ncbi:hypothetical protein [Helicobacter canis]|nr:hypothetical protein [Helicobacter canis]
MQKCKSLEYRACLGRRRERVEVRLVRAWAEFVRRLVAWNPRARF